MVNIFSISFPIGPSNTLSYRPFEAPFQRYMTSLVCA